MHARVRRGLKFRRYTRTRTRQFCFRQLEVHMHSRHRGDKGKKHLSITILVNMLVCVFLDWIAWGEGFGGVRERDRVT
jgi:hypothetical protein